MEQQKDRSKKKGGRPAKDIRRSQLLGTKCTPVERNMIEEKAQAAGYTVSEYLRRMALTGKIDRCQKALPAAVLQLTATLNHVAANLNQIARKRNSMDELNAIERAELGQLSEALKRLAQDIKNHLK